MKTYTFSAQLLKRFIGVIVLMIMLQGCSNMSDSDSVPIPVKSQKPFDPIEELADKMIQDPAFLAILEQQVWMNNQVEEFLFRAPEVERSAVVSVIQSWQGTTYEFSAEDWDIAQKVLGFPDKLSLEQYQTEMDLRLKAFAANYAGTTMSPEEWKQLVSTLANRVVNGFQKPSEYRLLDELEFRIADCCCAVPNECSTILCNQIDACQRDATSTLVTWTFGGAGLGGTLGSGVPGPGTMFGLAVGGGLGLIVGGVLYGSASAECHAMHVGCINCGCE